MLENPLMVIQGTLLTGVQVQPAAEPLTLKRPEVAGPARLPEVVASVRLQTAPAWVSENVWVGGLVLLQTARDG